MELYRHKVGKAFQVLHRGMQPETWEDYIIYRALYSERQVYCLPLSRFIEGGKYTRIAPSDLSAEELALIQW